LTWKERADKNAKAAPKLTGTHPGVNIPKLNDFDWVGFLGRSFMCTLSALVLETDGRGACSAQARRAYLCCVFVALLMLPTWESLAHGQLFESDSKRFGNTKMDIKVREVERRELSSVIQVDIQSVVRALGLRFSCCVASVSWRCSAVDFVTSSRSKNILSVARC